MDIKLTCPKCEKTFSANELFEHNSNEYNKFINEKVNKKLSEVVLEKEKQINKDKFLEIENLKIKLEKEKSDFERNLQKLKTEEIQDKLEMISSLKNKINSMEETKKLEIENYKAKLDAERTRFQNELISKQQKENQDKLEMISSLKNKINSMEETKKLEIENYKAKLEAEKEKFDQQIKIKLLEMEDKIKSPLLEQIEILKLANEKHKIINSKVKGENFEHEVEAELKKVFGFVDKIEKINDSSQEKADFLQTVIVDKNKIGKIVYEVKNAKWSDGWVEKLVKDCARKNSKYGILVATSFKEKYGSIPFIKSTEYDNIWITDDEGFIFVAQILRKLVEVDSKFEKYASNVGDGKNEEQLNELFKIKNSLSDYLKNDLKVLISDFEKEFKKMTKVRNSLIKNSNDITVVEEKLRRKINSQIIKKLETISGETFEYGNDDEDNIEE
ncbi:DUF2130 domain-containing protein [Spiroplasma endosymbiont of Crioceris asparagi]|uniref:DUF2130 domain-containing protein n=1 Tax=Spiroplasma endosymbiont of Crioceris asparagi TaxID=3066286 RepID=UPI0030D5D529